MMALGSKLPGDRASLQMGQELMTETFKHLKSVGIMDPKQAQKLIPIAENEEEGVVAGGENFSKEFLASLSQHRHWNRFALEL